ncbi:MAG: hypothetical protein EXQ95_09360 [Alphaproteobacteria bacterium]|nr:hypothetical protein [Alphaproteobacteria bacterium]
MLELALLLAIPIAIAEFGWVGLRRLAPEGYFKVPVLTGAAKLLGVAAGILLLSSRYDQRFFDLHDLFVPESPWNLSLWDFLTERVNPLNYGLGPLVADLGGGDVSRPLAFGLALIGLLLLAVLALPFAFWPAAAARRGIACGLLIALIVTYLTLYSICVLMWTLFLLNFWAFAVLAVVFQYYRSRT